MTSSRGTGSKQVGRAARLGCEQQRPSPVEQSPAGCKVWDRKCSALLEVQRLGQGVDSVIRCQSELCITARNCAGAEDPVPFLKKR